MEIEMDLQERVRSPCEFQHKKRGRPSGKNRIPLSLDERRARNALYERERRQAASEAISILAEATGCDPTLSNADILATAVSQLQRTSERSTDDDISELRRCNEKLILQVEALEQRLSSWEERKNESCKDTNDDQDYTGDKRKGNFSNKKSNKRKKSSPALHCSSADSCH